MTTIDERDDRPGSPGEVLDPQLEADLEEAFSEPPGIIGFITTVDHKRVGMRYIVTAFVFFFIAGIEALVMRTQLAQPEAEVVGASAYNSLFTMHGTTMIFLFNTPVLAGFANYLLPLQLGARDMAFPRLNAFSYWVFLGSGVFMYSSFLFGAVPDGGWFAYVPLTGSTYSPGLALDFWALGVIFVGISTTVGAINFIVTIFKQRAPGMTANRMPIFVWSVLAMAVMVIFAVPAVTLSAALLEADRLGGTGFFVPEAGGSTLLYQHLFWFWGHPEVYILLLPAVGMMSTIIPVFARRRLAGYVWVVSALVGIAFISFGVWVHHMFATGMPPMAMALFSAVSLVVVLPSGIQFFAWIATMWDGHIRWSTPMLFSVGFLIIFLIGGLTGAMVAVLPFDTQVTDSYFIVAHFHYVLNGAVVFPIFGALYFWLPKMTGRMLSERLGKASFWTMAIGFNLTFFPMHVLGLMGMPRRVYTYQDGYGWGTLNLAVTIGGFLFGLGTLLTVIAIWRSRRHGAPAGPDPWGAATLEWSTTSPPPDWNFAATPVVTSRDPMWEPVLEEAVSGDDDATAMLGPEGAEARRMVVTTGVAAVPETSSPIPDESYAPFVAGVGLTVLFAGLLVWTGVVAVIGVVVVLAAIVRWTWRTEEAG